jgi:hypothetical protein
MRAWFSLLHYFDRISITRGFDNRSADNRTICRLSTLSSGLRVPCPDLPPGGASVTVHRVKIRANEILGVS